MAGTWQNRLIYFPVRAPAEALLQRAEQAGFEPWKGAASGEWHGWRFGAAEPAARRMVLFHGNAGFALHRMHQASMVAESTPEPWEVYVFEYPGYGFRDGELGEESFKTAARRAVAELLADNERPLYLMGESLGGGLAAFLAAEFAGQVEGVLLVTPFTDLADVGAHHYPWLPVRWLLRDRFDTREPLRRYGGRLAVVLAGRDEVVPTRFGRRLYEEYEGPKELWVLEEHGHNDINYHPRTRPWRQVLEFLTREAQERLRRN